MMVKFTNKRLEVQNLIHARQSNEDDFRIESLIAEHPKIFAGHEQLFANVIREAMKILSNEQQDKLYEIYVREREMKFGGLHEYIASSLRPIFEVRRTTA